MYYDYYNIILLLLFPYGSSISIAMELNKIWCPIKYCINKKNIQHSNEKEKEINEFERIKMKQFVIKNNKKSNVIKKNS